jgi:ribulose-phosphate 3-epimerase
MIVKMAPSILSADFMALGKDVVEISKAGADYIHFDVMDGHFVPNLTLGVPFVSGMKRVTDTPLDVHLMISNPEVQVPWYLDAGADNVTIHIEACDDVEQCRRVLAAIREAGATCGISLNPETSEEKIAPVLDVVDLVLVMSVHPGFGGQSFIETTPDKISNICGMCSEIGVSPEIEVDGGINPKTAPLVAAAGATMLVAGSAIFGKDDPAAAMDGIRKSAEQASGN